MACTGPCTARVSGDAYGRAVQALRKSVELDPGYAQAWAALAQALYWAADRNATAWDPKVEWPRAQAAAEKAIALAPNLADGYTARATLRVAILKEWAGARADLERARSRHPPDGARARADALPRSPPRASSAVQQTPPPMRLLSRIPSQ